MKTPFLPLMSVISWFLMGCKQSESITHNEGASAKQIMSKYDAAVQSGLRENSYPGQFNSLFPVSVNGISYYTGEMGQSKWYSKTGLYGKYVLRMYFEIKLNNERAEIVSMAPPNFDLYEIKSIKINPGGSASMQTEEVAKFSLDTWRRLIQSKGDFRAAGITLETNMPVEHFEEVWRKL